MGKDDWKIAFKAAFKQAAEAEAQAVAAQQQATLAKDAAVLQQKTSKETVEAAEAELKQLTANPKINPKRQIKAATETRDTAQEALRVAALAETAQAKALADAQAQEVEARAAQGRAVLAARTDYGRARRRLVELLKKVPTGADRATLDGLYGELETAYQADRLDVDLLYQKLEDAEAELLKLTAPALAQPLYDEVDRRLKAFDGHALFSSTELAALRKRLKTVKPLLDGGKFGEAMPVLHGELAPALDRFEADAHDLTVLKEQLDQQLATLAADPLRSDQKLDAIRLSIKSAVNQAHKGSVAQGVEALGALSAAFDDARQWAAENAEASADYPAERVAVAQAATQFEQTNGSYAQECRAKVRVPCIESAAHFAGLPAGTTDFVTAMFLLGKASSTLISLQAKVDAKQQKLSLDAQEKAEAAALAAALAKQAAAKKAKEEAERKALVPSSLAKIGKSKMAAWLAQLERLLYEAKPSPVKLVAGAAKPLKKFEDAIFTVEVECKVQTTASAPVDSFVVHYHPTLSRKDVDKSVNASRFHSKQGRSVKPIFKLDEDTHWLVAQKHVPHINSVPDS